MQAVWLEEHGGPEVLRVVERPDPETRPRDALIEVRACGLNHLDIWVRTGARPFPLPLVPGTDAAGVVLWAPEESDLEPGDEVVVYPCEGCGWCPACERGDDQLCREFRIFGAVRDGALAEKMAVPARGCVRKPPSLDCIEGAAVAVNYVTAWHMLVGRAHLRPGETVLIQAAGSGVSTAGIQIASFLGARVVATSSTEAKLEHARRLGAELALDYRSDDVADKVLEWTGGRGVDVVFDHVGVPNWEANVRSLSKGGRLVFCGATGGPGVEVHLGSMYLNGQSLLGSTMGTREEFRTVLGLMERGAFRPVIDRVFPLAEIAEAHRYLESASQMGKVAIRVTD